MGITQYQPYGLPGQVRSFSAKTAADTVAIHILSTGPLSPLHASDSGDNLLLAGVLEAQGAGWFEGVLTVKGIADGGLTSYDLKVGDTATPDYGMMQIGNSVIGRTSYKVGNIDLDGSMLVRNISGPITGEIEFIWTESTGNTCRFALPKSAVGNATYNSRSMLLAGPAPADTDFVKVSYWQGQGIFDNLTCDTASNGADLGVQHDLEVENDIFTDSIKESTTDAGITLNDKIKITSIGSIAILLTNKTGGVSVAGELVSAHTSVADAVEQSPTTSATTVGVFLESGVADGSEAWVVVAGITVVHMDNNTVSLGDRIVSSTTIAGRGLASNNPSNTAHFTEIGHCIQAGAENSTVRCVLHFN